MQSFDHTLRSEGGLHARPAGMLVHAAKEFDSDVLIRKLGADGAKEADGKRLISIMSLGARRGDTITFFINGPDEENAARRIREVCRENIL